ncbi:MAG: tetratricopeptide repeat protein, partial [Methylocella sp.]
IQGYLVNQEIEALQANLPFHSYYLAAAETRFTLPPIPSLSPVYQDAARNDINALKRRAKNELPDDPYFKIALGRLILFHEGQMTPLESERHEAYRFFQEALQSSDPYIHWILRAYSDKAPYDLSHKDPFFLMTAVLISFRPDAVDRDAVQRAMDANVKDVNYLRDLGEVLNRTGRPADAQTVWHQALAQTGSDRASAASLQIVLGNTASAMSIFKELYAKGGKGASLYLRSLVGLYDLLPTPTEAQRAEKVRYLIQLGRPYAAIELICSLDKDSDMGKCGQKNYPDLMILSVSAAIQQLTTALIAAGVSGSDLAEAHVADNPYVRALVDQTEIAADAVDRVAYLRGDCLAIESDTDLKNLCENGEDAQSNAVQDMLRDAEPGFIAMLAAVFGDIVGIETDPKKLLLLAREAALVEAEKANYMRATMMLDMAISKNAADAGAYFDKGSYLLIVGRGRAKEAEIALNQARRMGYPNPAVVTRKIAQAILIQNRVRDAVSELQIGIQQNPNDIDLHLDLLGLAIDNKAYGTAESELRTLMQLDPGHYTTYQVRLVNLYVESGEAEKGVAEARVLYDRIWNDAFLQDLAQRMTAPVNPDEKDAHGKPPVKVNVTRWVVASAKFPLFQAYLQAADFLNKGNSSKAVDALKAASAQYPDD